MGIEMFSFPDIESEVHVPYTYQKVLVNSNYGYSVSGPQAAFFLSDIFSERPHDLPPFSKLFIRTKGPHGKENIYLITHKGGISNRRENVRLGMIHFEQLTDETMHRSPLSWGKPFNFFLEDSIIPSNTSLVEEIIVIEHNPDRLLRFDDLPQNSIEADFRRGFHEQV